MSDQSIFPEWRSFLGNSSDSETKGFLKSVVKRSGEIAEYDRSKIEAAIGKAIEAEEKRKDPERASKLTDMVEEKLRKMGLVVGSVYMKESDKDVGTVLDQDPQPGSKINKIHLIKFVRSCKFSGLTSCIGYGLIFLILNHFRGIF